MTTQNFKELAEAFKPYANSIFVGGFALIDSKFDIVITDDCYTERCYMVEFNEDKQVARLILDTHFKYLELVYAWEKTKRGFRIFFTERKERNESYEIIVYEKELTRLRLFEKERV